MKPQKPTAKENYDAALLGGMIAANLRAQAAPYGGTEPPQPGAASKEIRAKFQAAFGPIEFVSPNELYDGPQPFGSQTDAEVGELADTIKQSGKLDPLVANRRTDGRLYVIDGHTRKRAIATLDGFEKIPVQVARQSLDLEQETAWAHVFQFARRNRTLDGRLAQYRAAASKKGLDFDATLTLENRGRKGFSVKNRTPAILTQTAAEIAQETGIPKARVDLDLARLRKAKRAERDAASPKPPEPTARQALRRRGRDAELIGAEFAQATLERDRLKKTIAEARASLTRTEAKIKKLKAELKKAP